MHLKLCELTGEDIKACILFPICNFEIFSSKETDLKALGKVGRNWVEKNGPIGVIFQFSPSGPKQTAFGLSFIRDFSFLLSFQGDS